LLTLVNKNKLDVIKIESYKKCTREGCICIGSFSVTKYKFNASAAAATVEMLTIHSDPTGGHCSLPTGQHAFLKLENLINEEHFIQYRALHSCQVNIQIGYTVHICIHKLYLLFEPG